MTYRRYSIFGITAALLLLSCDLKRAAATGDEARFGVFFGGQLQEREELPFEIDSSKQRVGFRVRFERPLPSDTQLTWELSQPGPTTRKRPLASPAGRITQVGHVQLKNGRLNFDQSLPFRPGDHLGLWNIRVVLGDSVLIDRPFTVYDRARRNTAKKKARIRDAGL